MITPCIDGPPMADKPTRPTVPAEDDVVIWEPRDPGSDKEARWLWLVYGGRLTAQYCYTRKAADRAITQATSYAKVERVDVWIRRDDDDPPQRWKSFRQQQ